MESSSWLCCTKSNMSQSCLWYYTFLVLWSRTTVVRPDSSAVYILNEHLQLVTSTSLRWVSLIRQY